MENNSTNNKKNWITPELIEESLKETEGKTPHPTEGGLEFGIS